MPDGKRPAVSRHTTSQQRRKSLSSASSSAFIGGIPDSRPRRVCSQNIRRRFLNRVHLGLLANPPAANHQAKCEHRARHDEQRAGDPFHGVITAPMAFRGLSRPKRVACVVGIVGVAINRHGSLHGHLLLARQPIGGSAVPGFLVSVPVVPPVPQCAIGETQPGPRDGCNSRVQLPRSQKRVRTEGKAPLCLWRSRCLL